MSLRYKFILIYSGKGQELSNDTHEYKNILKDKYTDKTMSQSESNDLSKSTTESGLYLYIDLHGHASKKGVFMYGNHFTDPEDTIMCMLLPKLMSINNPNFHFTSCNFAERNMYLMLVNRLLMH